MSDDDVGQMIDDCEARSSKLSDWETDFIDSISKSYVKYGSLTTAQKNRLEQIWERVT